WRPIPIGRTSFYPPAHEWLVWGLRGFPDATSLALLDRLGLRTVVVHPRVWDDADRDARVAAVQAEPRLMQVASFDDVPPVRFAPLGLGGERVYTLQSAAPPAAPCVPAGELAREGWTVSGTGVNKPERVADGD